MNPDLDRLHSYSFQKLNALLERVKPDSGCSVVPMHIGEPKHATPEFIKPFGAFPG